MDGDQCQEAIKVAIFSLRIFVNDIILLKADSKTPSEFVLSLCTYRFSGTENHLDSIQAARLHRDPGHLNYAVATLPAIITALNITLLLGVNSVF